MNRRDFIKPATSLADLIISALIRLLSPPLRALAAKILFLLCCACATAAPVPDGKPHKFALGPGAFLIDGQTFKIVAGEMHPARVLPEFWEDRIKKAKAMGLNTVSILPRQQNLCEQGGSGSFASA